MFESNFSGDNDRGNKFVKRLSSASMDIYQMEFIPKSGLTKRYNELSDINPFALRMAKTLWSSGRSDCKRG